MPLLTMLYTRKGRENSGKLRQYQQGNTYCFSKELAKAFLAAGYAVYTKRSEKLITAKTYFKQIHIPHRSATMKNTTVIYKKRRITPFI